MGSSKKTTTTNSTSNVQTTPNVPAFAMEPTSNYYGQVGALGQSIGQNPYQFTTPANGLQQQAATNASNLGGYKSLFDSSAYMAQQAADAQTPQAQQTLAGVALASMPNAPQALNYNPASADLFSTKGVNLGPTQTSLAQQANAYGYQAPTLGQLAQATGGGFGGASAGPAQQATAQGYDIANLGAANTYQAPNLGAAGQASTQGYDPSLYGGAQIGALTNAQAATFDPNSIERVTAAQANAASLLDGAGIGQYMSPYQQQVIDAAMADFDAYAAKQQQEYKAAGARSGAFGGSRYGIGEAQMAGELSRARNSSLANLLTSGYQSALGAAQFDTGNRQQTYIFNTGAQNTALSQNAAAANQGLLSNSAYQQQANMQNAAAANDRTLAQANLAQQAGLSNQQAQNQASQFGADAANQASIFNTGQANQFALNQGNLDAQAGQFNANAQNQYGLAQFGAQNDANAFLANANNQTSQFNAGQANDTARTNAALANSAGIANMQNQSQLGMFNAGQANDRMLAQAQMEAQAGQFGANAQNAAALQNAQLGTQNNQFNAGQANDAMLAQANLTQQSNLANQQAANQNSIFNAGQANEASQYNASAGNALNSQIYGMQGQYGLANQDALNQASIFNSGQANQLSQFNSAQQAEAIARDLQAAGLLGDLGRSYGSLAQGDIASQLAAGGSLWDIQNQYNMAPLTITGAYGNLLNPSGVMNTVTGQNVYGTENGTSVQKGSGGLLGTLGAIASIAATAAPLASDRRLKKDIELVGREPDGLGVYRYRYNWDNDDEPKRSGVMHDEVAQLRPWAVGPDLAGYGSVDYAKLEAA